MGQGFKKLCTSFHDVCSFIQNVVIVLSQFMGAKQKKFDVSHCFLLSEQRSSTHSSTQKIAHHIKKHHRKYLFWWAFSFLLIKLLVTFLATYNTNIYAQTPQDLYTIWNAIIESTYEQCDDGNTDSGDGCDNQWQIENGFTCMWSPSICAPTASIVTGLFDALLENTDYGQSTPASSGQISDQQIIQRLYGPQSTYTTQRSQKLCSLTDMKVEHLFPGMDALPRYPSANTIYVLPEGDYINDYMINIQSWCTAIIGEWPQTHFYTLTTRWANIKISSGASNVIIDQLILHSITDGLGETHTGNNYGIFVGSPSNTVSNIQVKDPVSFAVYMEDFNNTITTIQRLDKNILASQDMTVNTPVVLPSEESFSVWWSTLATNGYVWSGGFWWGILPLDLSLTSKLFLPINFSSSDQRITISFLSWTIFTTQEGLNYNGIILWPKSVSFSEVKSEFSGEQILDAFKVLGNQWKVLLQNSSWAIQKASVSVKLPTPSNFYGASIFYSTGGDNWKLLKNTKITTISGEEYTNFEIDTLWYFVITAYAWDLNISTGTITTWTITTWSILSWATLSWTVSTWSVLSWAIGSWAQSKTWEKLKWKDNSDKQARKQFTKDRLTARGFSEDANGKMKGRHSINLEALSWEISVPVIMQSTGNIGALPIEVEFSEWTIVTTQGWSGFTGILNMPQILNKNQIRIFNQEIVSAIKVWPDDQHLFFKDLSWNDNYVTIRVPTPDLHIWDSVVISYSNDGININHLTDIVITWIDGKAFAIFQTNHFTEFYLWVNLWNFRIANDAVYITWSVTTLNTTLAWATQMKFGNTPSLRDSTGRQTYATSYPWTLITWDGIRWVYAMFSGWWISSQVKDEIIVDTTAPPPLSNYVMYVDGSGAGTTFYNIAAPTNNFTATAVTTWAIWSQVYMIFNGTTSFLQDSTWITATYPFTMMAWVKPSRVSWTQTLFWESRTNKTNIYYAAAMSGNKFWMICDNGAAEVNNRWTTVANTWTRYYVALVFASDTSRKLYINGNLEATGTGTCAYAQNGNNRQVIWRMGDSTPDRYFSGYIDEFRFYTLDLSANISALDFLYMGKVTAKSLVTFDTTPTLYGTIFASDTFRVQISGVNNPYNQTFTGINDLQKKWTLPSSSITPALTTWTYTMNLIQTDSHGATRITAYPSALIINPVSVLYSPSSYTTGNVTATLTWLYETDIITNNNSSPSYLFTDNGSFIYEYIDDNGNTWSTTATVTWIDRQGPTVSTWYISAWTTWTNGWNLYYKWTINIRADVSDAWAWLSWATCQYTTWTSRAAATYSWAGWYCEATNLAPAANINVQFRIQDTLGNQGTWIIWTYNYDITPPTWWSFTINSDVAWTASTWVTLNITCPTDAWIWWIEVAYGTWASPTNRSSCTATTSQTLDAGDGTKTVYMRFRDAFQNTTVSDVTDTILLDKTWPTVGTWYITLWTTGANGNTWYYKWAINIRANVSDGAWIWLNSVTCEYTTDWSSRALAVYQTTYCEAIGISPAADINIRFRIQDTLWNQGTWIIWSYTYDATPPTWWSFTINNNVAYTSVTGVTLNIACPTDAWIWWAEVAYGNTSTPTNRTWCAATKAYTFSTPTDGTKTVYMRFRDTLLNTTTSTTDTILLDKTWPTIPQLITPTSWQTFTTWSIQLRRSGAIDTGMWVSWYVWQMSTGDFSSVYLSWFTSTTWINLSSLPDNTYYWRVYAIDTIGFTWWFSQTYPLTIDTTKPTATVTYSRTWLTNQDVITTLTWYSETLTWINATWYTFTGNGTFTFTFSDLAGNTGEAIATVTWIDKTKPTATVTYSITWLTTRDVITTLTWYSETLTWINATWYTFTGNGTFTFTFSDLAGNTWSTTATVTWMYIPSVTWVTLIPTLSASYFGNYDLASTISGTINSASVDFNGINADWGNCTHYYASGSCMTTWFNYPLSLSGGQIWQATGIRPDQIYPQISFATTATTRNNIPEETTLTTNAYSLLHMQNKFSMTGNTSFWIELNTLKKSATSVNLSVYVVEKWHDTSYFTGDWLSKTGVEMIGVISKDADFNHIHTANSEHHLIALSTNANGTIGSKNLNLSGDFWIVLYPNTTDTNRWWSLRYQPSSLCQNTSGRYQGNKWAWWTTTYQSGCPDAHIHVAKRGTNADWLNAVVTATYNSWAKTVSWFNNFYFGAIANMSPNPTAFILPIYDIAYTWNINISWHPATDPNNDALTYNIQLLDATWTTIQALATGLSSTWYILTKGAVADGEYGLKIQACDGWWLCSTSYLDGNFFTDTTKPTATVTYSTTWRTTQDVITTLTWYSETLTWINATWYTFTGNGTFTFTFSDLAGNTGEAIATVTWIDKVAPTLSTWYIFSWTTWSYIWNLYYKWASTIRSNITDDGAWLSWATCEYNKWLWRYPAIYSGTALSWYCEVTWVNGSDLYLRFRIADIAGNTTTSATWIYLYDATPPLWWSFVINTGATYTTTTWVTLNITCPTDTWVNNVEVAYGTWSNPSNRTTCSSTKSQTLSSSQWTKTVYMRFRDVFNNITNETTDTIILDIDKPIVSFTWSSLNYFQNDVIYEDFMPAEIEIQEPWVWLQSFYRYRNKPFALYDSSMVVFMNMNNVAALWESEWTIIDVWLSANHGSWVNVSFVETGKFFWGYEFSGYDAHVKLNGTTWVDLGRYATVSIYVYPYTKTGLHIIAWWNTTGSFALWFDENNLYYQTDPSSVVSVPYNMALNTWSQVRSVRSGNTVAFYANGVQIWTTQTLSVDTSMIVWYLGKKWPETDSGEFVGMMDEIKIFDRAMTSQEISERFYINTRKTDPSTWRLIVQHENLVEWVTNTYYGYATDKAGNTWYTEIRTVRYALEQDPPSVPNAVSPLSWSTFATWTLDLEWTTSVDTWVWMIWYERDIATDADFTNIVSSWFTADPDTWTVVTWLVDGIYYRHVNAQDLIDNDSAFSETQMFIIDTTAPVVSTWYIAIWLTWEREWVLYFKWTIEPRADVYDVWAWLDIWSCESSSWQSWMPAFYSWTSTSGYCYQNGTPIWDINLRFRIADILWRIWTWSTWTYIYDATPPSWWAFTINNNTTWTNVTWVTLNITCPTDAWVSGIQIAYGNDPSPTNRTTCSATKPWEITTWDEVKTVYMRFKDALSNITTNISDTIIYDTAGPIAPSLISPTDNSAHNTWTVQLRWSTGFDAWVGISGYMRQVSTDNFSSIYLSWNTNNTWINISALPQNTYQRRVHAHDSLGNMWARSSWRNFVVDLTVPTLTTGYVSSWMSDTNLWNIYYKWIINIRSDVSDTGGSLLSWATCQYATGSTRATATYSWAGWYCEVTWLNYQADFAIRFRILDIAGNTWTSVTWNFLYDATPPSWWAFTINNGATWTNTTWVTLNITCPTDGGVEYVQVSNGSGMDPENRTPCVSSISYTLSTGDGVKTVYMRFKDALSNITTNISDTIIYDTAGPIAPSLISPTDNSAQNTWTVQLRWSTGFDAWVGISGYMRQVSTDNFSSVYLSWNTSNTWINISALPQNTYQRRVHAHDSLDNMWARSSWRNFVVDLTVPTLTTGYVSSWMSDTNLWNIYYKWIINVRSDVSDTWWSLLSWATCQYATGSTRAAATYSWAGWYCEVTWLNYQADFAIRFRILDIAGNTWTSATWNFLYDATPPSWWAFTINNGATWTNTTWVTLNITCPTDTWWVGYVQVSNGSGMDPENRTLCVSSIPYTLSTGDAVKTVYMRFKDALSNITTNISDTIIYDTAGPTIWAPTMYSWNYTWLYFNGEVSVRSSILDTSSQVKPFSCEVDIWWWRTDIWVTQDSDYCYYTGYAPEADFDILFRVQDNALNYWISTTWSFIHDDTPPAWWSFKINNDATYTNATWVTLNITCPTDTWWVGYVQVSNGPDIDPENRVSCSSSLPYTLSTGDWGKVVYMRFRDALLNTTTNITDIIILDQTSPSLWAPTIFTWNYNGSYFNGIVGLRATISDTLSQVKSVSCEVDTWAWRTTTWVGQDSSYCYYTGYNPQSNITIKFRLQDNALNYGTSSISNYTYDATIPVISTGYISLWTTWINGNTWYYKWTINIRANVSDAWVWLSWATCQYTTWTSRVNATYNTTYCEATNLAPAANINIRFRIQDVLWTLWTWATWTYLYDITPPPLWSFTINNDDASTNTRFVTLNIACPTDTWVNAVEVAYWNTASPTNRTWCAATKPHTLLVGNGTKTVYMRFRDTFQNTVASDVTDAITLNIIPPTVSTWFVSSGISAINGNTWYYQWTIDVRANVTDEWRWLNGSTCQYTTWSSRASAAFNFTYCEVTWLTYTSTLNVQFRIADDDGTMGTWWIWIYAYDVVPPTQANMTAEPAYTQWTTNTVWTTGSTDTWANGTQYEFCRNTTDTTAWCISAWWTGSTWTTFTWLSGGQIYYYFVRSKDSLWNTWWRSTSTFSTQDTLAPTYTRNTPTPWTRYTSWSTIAIDVSITETWAWVTDWSACNAKIDWATNWFTWIVSYSWALQKCIWTLTLNSGLPDGPHNLTIQVADSVSNSWQSSSIAVNFDNTLPSSIILSVTNFTHNTRWNYVWVVTWSIVWTRWPSSATIEYTTWWDWINIWTATWFAFIPTDWTTNVQMRVTDVWWWPISSNTFTIKKDSVWPLAPELISPTSWQTLNTWNIQLRRSWSIDAGIWLSWYVWQVSTWATFTNIYLSWSTLNTWININWLSSNAYYRRVYAYDQFNATWWRSSWWNFIVQLDSTPPTIIFTWSTPVSWSTTTWNNFITQIAIDEPSDILGNFSYSSNWASYNIYSSGVILMYNFDNVSALGENSSTVKDASQYGRHATVSSADQTWVGVRNGGYSFDGTNNKYIQIWSTGIDLWTTHTISLWANPRSDLWVILGANTNVYGVFISWAKVFYAPSNGNSVSFDTIVSLNRWTQLSIVRNWTNVSLYQNWSLVSTQILSSNDSLTLKYIGKENNDWSNEKRFNWTIDELYIYNRVLSTWEISQLSRSSLSKYDTGKWLYTVNYQCIASWITYVYSWSASDLANNQSQIVRSSTLAIPSTSLDITAASLNMGKINRSHSWEVATWAFTEYFKVVDRLWTTWWYTTLTLPSTLTWQQNPSHTIAWSNVFIKASGVNILSGLSTEYIYVAWNFSDYVSPSQATTYIKRDISNIPFMCPAWVYGNNPLIRIDVPARQAIDTYSGTITYDIIY